MGYWKDIVSRMCVVVAWGALVIAPACALAATPAPSPAPRDMANAARWLSMVLLVVLLAAVAFFTGLFILRSIQRARERVLRRPPKPTESSDVWRQHKLPDEGPDAEVWPDDED